MQSYLLALLLPALALAAPTPTTDAAAALGSPICVFTSAPAVNGNAMKAYAAYLPNPELTSDKIDNYFSDFSFACEPGSSFSAYTLDSSKDWFGGIVQLSGQDQCTPASFAGLVDFAMEDGNKKQFNVACTKFDASQTGTFYAAAKKYFASVQK